MLPRFYLVRIQPENPQMQPHTCWVSDADSHAEARKKAARLFVDGEILSVTRVYPCTDCRGLICTCGRDVLAYDGP